jgi:hypothetical protein
MARKPEHDRALLDLLHLEEEEIALLATGDTGDTWMLAHAATCPRCAERLEAARDVMSLEPFSRRAEPGRLRSLMQRLTEAGALPPATPPRAFVRLAFEGSAVCVLETDTQVRIAAAVATRQAQGGAAPSGVTFFRNLGELEVELHLVRVPGDSFHLVVSVQGGDPEELRVALRRGRRELATMPVPSGAATFKNLRPGAPYAVDVQRRATLLGSIDLEVQAPREVPQ